MTMWKSFHLRLICLLSILLSIARAAPLAGSPSLQSLNPRQACNTATNRQCWTSTFNINTDWESSTPSTGVTRTYTLRITQVASWVGGDGATKTNAMLVNGQFPGPAITANWGDTISITVVNNMQTNGTSIHYHGLHMKNANTQDGVGGVTQCPIPPGGSKTYTFRATQYGTAWYHSHFPSQYGNGVLGPIVINGPASANYDTDLGPLVISDWYYGSTFQLAHRVNNPNNPYIPGFPGSPPPSNNVLFNGKNRSPTGSTGTYNRMTVTAGSKHLLRLINASVQTAFTVTLVGHSFQIVATDMVPIQPVTVTNLFLGVGQRYDVIITANQPVGHYWFNVTFPNAACGSSNNPRPAAIFSYSGATPANGNPTSAGTVPPDSRCADSLAYSPVVTRTAPGASTFTPPAGSTLTAALQINNALARVFWPVNNSPMKVVWGNPTLKHVQAGTAPGSLPASANVVSVPTGNTLVYFLVQNNSSIPHPIHLHGHDLLLLGASPALANPISPANRLRAYNPSTDAATLKVNNPTRRDTTMLPAWGWIAVAFRTNNPGAWLFHCHVAWHASQGFSVQFLEQLSAIPGTVSPGLADITPNCNAWNAWYPANAPFLQDDSGI